MDLFKNFAKVQVSTGYDASATSIALTAGHGTKLPTPPFNATWWNSTDFADPSDDPNVEIVRVTAKSTDTLTVTRAQESTTASTKNTASKTYRMIAGLTAKTLNTDLGMPTQQAMNGRLTLESGIPFSATDQTAKTTIYFTPYHGNCISLYNGAEWICHPFAELSLALGTLMTDKHYDVFVYDNAGTLTLELSAAWASDSARTDALGMQEGIYIKSGAPTRRYLGTFRTTSTTTTEDSQSKRFLWNLQNQIVRRAYKQFAASHIYTGGWRMYDGNAANKTEIVVGLPEVANLSFSSGISSGGTGAYAGIGINTIAAVTDEFAFGNSTAGVVQGIFSMPWLLALGYTSFNMLEYSPSGGSTFLGASISATLFN
jgi:hypothetical protein